MENVELVIKIPEKAYNALTHTEFDANLVVDEMRKSIVDGTPLPNCKDCRYFEYDSVAKVDGMPLIVAHEICSRWGGGCKTREDGYCFLFEPQESEDKE